MECRRIKKLNMTTKKTFLEEHKFFIWACTGILSILMSLVGLYIGILGAINNLEKKIELLAQKEAYDIRLMETEISKFTESKKTASIDYFDPNKYGILPKELELNTQ